MGRGNARLWHIGPLALHVRCLAREWRVTTREEPTQVDRFTALGPAAEVPAPEDGTVQRFATVPEDERITLRPQLADRAVVVRPDPALGLPPGHDVTFYMSMPAWVQLVSGQGTPLQGIPVTRPSDTWFGVSRMEGELCYASRTAARLGLDELPRRPGRVITEVHVRNHGTDLLQVERVQVPAPFLPVYATAQHTLWTPSITVVRKGDEPLAEVRVASGPPAHVGPTTLVASARKRGVPLMLVRALGALLT